MLCTCRFNGSRQRTALRKKQKETQMQQSEKKQTYATARIIESFLGLLSEKSYLDITVSEIVRRAGVARATFYRHFATAADVMDAVISQTSDKIKKLADSLPADPDEDKWRQFLSQYISFLSDSGQKLLGCRYENLPLILTQLKEKLSQLLNTAPEAETGERYRIPALLSMINGVLIRWRESGMHESRQEIEEYLLSIVTQF